MRIGKFGFLNNFLPYYRLERSGGAGDVIVEASPPILAEMLERGEVDFAPVPSFYYIKNRERLRTYNFCVASNNRHKKIFSVIVVSKRRKLGDEDIAVTSQSMTSANLLRIILRERGKNNRIIHANGKSADELLKKGPYALLIGDEALKARDKYEVVMDLGEEWYELTGYPMVFGISASLSHKDMSETDRKIMKSLEWGIRNIEYVVKEASEKTKMPQDFLRKYFLAISYRMGASERKGLEVFREMCIEHRLLTDENKQKRIRGANVYR